MLINVNYHVTRSIHHINLYKDDLDISASLPEDAVSGGVIV